MLTLLTFFQGWGSNYSFRRWKFCKICWNIWNNRRGNGDGASLLSGLARSSGLLLWPVSVGGRAVGVIGGVVDLGPLSSLAVLGAWFGS